MANRQDSNGGVYRTLGAIGMVLAVCFAPPVFRRYFSMSDHLTAHEMSWLLVLAGSLMLLSVALLWPSGGWRGAVAPLYFSALLMLAIELIFRAGVVSAAPEVRVLLHKIQSNSFDDRTAYTGHPFVQFTGRPSFSLKDDQILASGRTFNNFGQSGGDYVPYKPPGILRVVALGGSTTADGYPVKLAAWLQKNAPARYEVLQFAHGWYTSAHDVVNFVLTVRDFSPDYVVIHQGWNDRVARNYDSDVFRSDYSHALDYYHEPEIVDRYVVRVSALYRYVRHLVNPRPPHTFLGSSILKKDARPTNKRWTDPTELKPFERNVQTIIDLARIGRITVVLTTHPHSVDRRLVDYGVGEHIDQCNAIVRALHARNADTILVDLDNDMTGRMDHMFVDLGHMTDDGIQQKASRIGRAIAAHAQRVQ